MTKTIIFDVDGVLADFVLAFTREVVEHSPFLREGEKKPWSTRENKSRWDFTDVFLKQEIEDAWSRIKGSPTWWNAVPPLEPWEVFDSINYLQGKYHVLFVTARVGQHPQNQTRNWLWQHGISEPNVVVTDKKGEIAKAVGASFHVDDKPENAACVHWMTDHNKCKSYFLEHEYRKGGDWLPEKIRRIKSVKEYIADIVKEGK